MDCRRNGARFGCRILPRPLSGTSKTVRAGVLAPGADRPEGAAGSVETARVPARSVGEKPGRCSGLAQARPGLLRRHAGCCAAARWWISCPLADSLANATGYLVATRPIKGGIPHSTSDPAPDRGLLLRRSPGSASGSNTAAARRHRRGCRRSCVFRRGRSAGPAFL